MTMKICLLLACLLVAVYARNTQHVEANEWELFKAQHGKKYDNPKEEQYRIKIFQENKAFVEAHNKRHANGEVSHFVAVNKFADLTNKEFVAMYNKYKPSIKRSSAPNVFNALGVDPPTKIDWRDSGAVTDVKNQGDCGCGWAFSTTGSIEGQHKLATGTLVSLSEQQLVDCDLRNDGCEGGITDNAFQYIILFKGIDSEESYTYTAEEDPCKATKKNIAATISSYKDIPTGDEASLTSAIGTVGPISVAVDGSRSSFQLYAGGVYSDPDCSSTSVDYGLLAVGYDTLEDQDYYIVKNSLGTDWGLSGYIYMSRNNENNCGIATAASFPVV